MKNKKIIIITLIMIPILSYGIAGMVAQGDKALWSVVFPFLGTYIGILATLWGIRYQIQKNEELKDKEKKEEEKSKKIGFCKYILHYLIVNRNSFYLEKDVEDLSKYFKRLVNSRGSLNRVMIQWIDCFDQRYFSKNLNIIMELPFGKQLLLVNDALIKHEGLLKNGDDFFKIRDIVLGYHGTSIVEKNNQEVKDILDVLKHDLTIISENFYKNQKDIDIRNNMLTKINKYGFNHYFDANEYLELVKVSESFIDSKSSEFENNYINRLLFLHKFIGNICPEKISEEAMYSSGIERILKEINQEINYIESIREHSQFLSKEIDKMILLIVREIQKLTNSDIVEGITIVRNKVSKQQNF